MRVGRGLTTHGSGVRDGCLHRFPRRRLARIRGVRVRIAVVHSFYRSDSPSGENQVVAQQVELLREAGHDVLLVARSSDELGTGLVDRVRLAGDVAFGSGADPSPVLAAFAPDVVHVHNLFPNFATRWLPRWRGPLVATLHNFRSVCANGVLIRSGRVCTQCPDGDRWAGVRHGCYRDSAVATLPIAVRNRRGIGADPLLARADRVIVLSPPARELFVRFGLPQERLDVVPNGVTVPDAQPQGPGTGCVAFGRLTAEKNWAQLVSDWPADRDLDVFGDGPLRQQLAASSSSAITWRGAIAHQELIRRLPEYRVAIFSGVNPEGAYPLTALESWAAGVALVARQGGIAADMVQRWGGGAVFRDRSDLGPAIEQAAAVPADACRQLVITHFSTTAWLDQLIAVYERAAAAH